MDEIAQEYDVVVLGTGTCCAPPLVIWKLTGSRLDRMRAVGVRSSRIRCRPWLTFGLQGDERQGKESATYRSK